MCDSNILKGLLPIVDSVFLPWYLCFYPAGNDDGVYLTVTTSCWRETLMLFENMSSKWLCLGCERFNIWGPRRRVRTSCSRSSKNHAGWVRPRVCPFPLPSFGLSRCFCFGLCRRNGGRRGKKTSTEGLILSFFYHVSFWREKAAEDSSIFFPFRFNDNNCCHVPP